MFDNIIKTFKENYTATFAKHGATPEGVYWLNQERMNLRHKKMLQIMDNDLFENETPTLLDIGCGYGDLLNYIKANDLNIKYSGIDLVEDMINHAQSKHPDSQFECVNALDIPEDCQYDYVVCNGILTCKYDRSALEMTEFMKVLIAKLFSLARCGVAFNTYSTYVNWFHQESYYKSPAELLVYCLENITHKVRLDHAYPLYEYCIYLYKND